MVPGKKSTPAGIPWRREWRHSANSTPLVITVDISRDGITVDISRDVITVDISRDAITVDISSLKGWDNCGYLKGWDNFWISQGM